MAKEEELINNNNYRENAKREHHGYEVGHYVYILRDGNCRNLEEEILGPFRITQVHTNGSVRIQRGIVNEKINI